MLKLAVLFAANIAHERGEVQARPGNPSEALNVTEPMPIPDLIRSLQEPEFYSSRMPSLTPQDVDEMMGQIQDLLDRDFEMYGPKVSDSRRHLRRLLLKLARDTNQLPSSIVLHGLSRNITTPARLGSYADIFCATYRDQEVALKRLRGIEASDVRKQLMFVKEALMWRQLRHPYIQPFLGICDTLGSDLCLVSPWMANDNVNRCIRKFKESGEVVPYAKWIYQVALGLEYLRSEGVVHGDLRGANILVDGTGQIRLTDFGLLWLADVSIAAQGSYNSGALRWMAPEVLCGARSTYESDVYSFACVCVEICTGAQPFPALTNVVQVTRAVMEQRQTPPWPLSNDEVVRQLQHAVASCWSWEADKRSSIHNLCTEIGTILERHDIHVTHDRSQSYSEPLSEDWEREPLPLATIAPQTSAAAVNTSLAPPARATGVHENEQPDAPFSEACACSSTDYWKFWTLRISRLVTRIFRRSSQL